MKLSDILITHVNSLYEELQKITDRPINQARIDVINNEQQELKTALDILTNNREKINEINFQKLIDIISAYSNINKSGFEEDVMIVKTVLIAIYDRHLNITMTPSQMTLFDNIISLINSSLKNLELESSALVRNLSKNNIIEDELIEDIEEIENIIEKLTDIDNNEFLTETEFNIIYDNIIKNDEVPLETRKQILIKISEYNASIVAYERKIVETVNIEQVISLVSKYKSTPSLIDTIKIHKEEVIANANVHNIEEILAYLQEQNLLLKFNDNSLLTICLYGSLASVKRFANHAQEVSAYSSMIFDTPSIWINNLRKTHQKIRRSRLSKQDIKSKQKTPLRSLAHRISYEDMRANETFLTSKDYDISIISKEGIKTLKTPHDHVVNNYNIYSLYNILTANTKTKFPVSVFSFSSVLEKCDMFIELGLLNSLAEDSVPNDNYVANNPSVINTINNEIFALLYKIKAEMSPQEYYGTVFSKNRIGCLDRDSICRHKLGYPLNSKTEITEFIKNNFVNILDDKYLEHAQEYEKIIESDDSYDYNPDILNNELINDLEAHNRPNAQEYIYEIAGSRISRLKVLRNASIIVSYGLPLTKEALVYCITRGSYLNETNFRKIASYIGFELTTGGEEIAIPRKI